MHEVLVNRLGGLSLPRKSVVRLTDRPDMTLDVYRGRKTTNQQQHISGYRVNRCLFTRQTDWMRSFCNETAYVDASPALLYAKRLVYRLTPDYSDHMTGQTSCSIGNYDKRYNIKRNIIYSTEEVGNRTAELI